MLECVIWCFVTFAQEFYFSFLGSNMSGSQEIERLIFQQLETIL